jgi:hypothetical protein
LLERQATRLARSLETLAELGVGTFGRRDLAHAASLARRREKILADQSNLFGAIRHGIPFQVASWAQKPGFVHESPGFDEYWCVELTFRYAKSFS